LPQSSGWHCTYEADEGNVLVVVPDHGSSFLQNNALVDPFTNGLGTRVRGIADSVLLFDNTAYVTKHHQSVSIAVLAVTGTTPDSTLTAFAKIVARRLP
jgi:hypothetical protein